MGITSNNLCDSCTNIGCEFQSGIVRTKCNFYMPPHIEPDNCGNYVVMQPTVEAIPKDQYEARLKADMVAMLTEIQLEIEELDSRAGYDGNGIPTFSTDYIRKKKVNELIQQKIDKLKEGNEPIKCAASDEEIAKSFIEDVEAVKVQLPTPKNDLGVDAVSRQFMRELGATCIATRDKNNKLIALGALDDLPSVTPQETRWIPCSEKKPDKGGEYLLWGKIDESEEKDYCFIGDYHEFDEVFGTEISNYDPHTLGFIDTEIEEYYSVVAWMPLPAPFEPQESEDKE